MSLLYFLFHMDQLTSFKSSKRISQLFKLARSDLCTIYYHRSFRIEEDKKWNLWNGKERTSEKTTMLSDCNWTRIHNHLVCKHSTIYPNWPMWLNGWVFVYEISGSGFESRCSHLNFRFRACFEQGVPWHSGDYRVWIQKANNNFITSSFK